MPSTNPESDIYVNISVIRDTLDTLLKRGKPASVADLQALMASVEAKSRPTVTLPAKEVAALLAPELLPLLPTSAALTQAGKDAAARMEAAIKGGTAVSVQQVGATMQQLVGAVQDAMRQTTALLAEHRAAAASYPRSIPVDFLQGWRWPTGLALGPVVLVLLLLWGCGNFSGVSQAKYDQLQQQKQQLTQANQKLLTQGRFYMDQVEQYRKKFPKTASYFPKYVAPVAGE